MQLYGSCRHLCRSMYRSCPSGSCAVLSCRLVSIRHQPTRYSVHYAVRSESLYMSVQFSSLNGYNRNSCWLLLTFAGIHFHCHVMCKYVSNEINLVSVSASSYSLQLNIHLTHGNNLRSSDCKVMGLFTWEVPLEYS